MNRIGAAAFFLYVRRGAGAWRITAMKKPPVDFLHFKQTKYDKLYREEKSR